MPGCSATTRTGQPCKAPALADDSFCFSHTPTLAAERAAARVKGGHGSSRNARLLKNAPPELADLVGKLQGLLADVESGTLPARVGEVAGTLCGRILDCYRLVYEVGEKRELDERLSVIEGQLKAEAWPSQ